jgi:hypothetical protein
MVDSLTVGAALVGILVGPGRRRDAAAARLWHRLRPRLDASPDASGALAELRSNPRNRAAGLVLGDEIGRILDAEPELFGAAVDLVGGCAARAA